MITTRSQTQFVSRDGLMTTFQNQMQMLIQQNKEQHKGYDSKLKAMCVQHQPELQTLIQKLISLENERFPPHPVLGKRNLC